MDASRVSKSGLSFGYDVIELCNSLIEDWTVEGDGDLATRLEAIINLLRQDSALRREIRSQVDQHLGGIFESAERYNKPLVITFDGDNIIFTADDHVETRSRAEVLSELQALRSALKKIRDARMEAEVGEFKKK